MNAKQFETIKYDIEDHIATITLNRPKHRNAMTVLMMQEMVQALDLIDTNDEVNGKQS